MGFGTAQLAALSSVILYVLPLHTHSVPSLLGSYRAGHEPHATPPPIGTEPSGQVMQTPISLYLPGSHGMHRV